MRLFLLLVATLCVSARNFVRYDYHQVWRVTPENLEQVERLHKLLELPNYADYDFWRAPTAPGRSVDLRLSPKGMQFVKHLIADMKYTVHIEDVQKHFEMAREPAGSAWDQAYHNLNDINNWMTDLVNANPSFVRMFSIGKTYEGREIYGLNISKASSKNPPQLYLDGGIHAREWMAPAVVQYIIGQLVNNQSVYDHYLQSFEWLLIPVFNADGYAYTWTNDQNWRKNRQPNTGSACIGTDPCRNADAGFGGQGSSNSPCSDTYHGAAAWSAPMMAAYRDYIQKLPRLATYVNFHSYAESWLNPYGYTNQKPADYNVQEANGKNCTDAIKKVNGANYEYGPAYTTIYPASGIPSDWVYDKLGVKLSQAVELRGGSFHPPASLIEPIGQELMAGVLKLADDVLFT